MSAPRAFLCSQDGTHNFPLTQRITTIGKENCDIIISNGNIDVQHALIEYIEDENCYLLQDLNSSSGTYVNDCRVQNATVRLVEQDTVKFGFNGIPFQFLVQSQFIAIPSINLSGINRSSQPLQIINQTVPSRGNRVLLNQSNGLVSLNNQLPNASLITINNQTQPLNLIPNCNTVTKPPATLRSRPITANTNNRIDAKPRSSSWIKGFSNVSSSTNINGGGDNIDSDTYRVEDTEVSSRVAQLERELKIKSIEIRDLREKVAFYKSQNGQNSVNNEFEQIKRDKSIAVGLVSTMQKDLASKDVTISKLAREIEGYKREIKDKDTAIKELGEQLKIANDTKQAEEEAEKKDKELIVLRKKYKLTEDRIVDLTNQVLQIKQDLEETQRKSQEYSKTEKNLKEELENSRIQFLDMQRTERTVRMDLEQVKRNFDKFRNFIIQTIYSTPGVTQPADTNITDEFLATEWKKIIDERTSLIDTINNLEKGLSEAEQTNSSITKSISDFESFLKEVESSLFRNGRRSTSLEAQIKNLTELEIHSELLSLKTEIIQIYSNEKNSQDDLEQTFKTSFNLDLNNTDSNRLLLLTVCQKFDTLTREKSELETKIQEAIADKDKTLQEVIESKASEFNLRLTELENELNLKQTQKIEDLNKEHEESLNLIKSDFQIQINQVSEEKSTLLAKIETLNVEIEVLKKDLEIAQAQDELHDIKQKLANSEAELKTKEEAYLLQISELTNKSNEADANYTKELGVYKEQIKQYSITIINFEKEIKRLREKEVEYLSKIESLDKKLKEHIFSKKPPSPKPSSPVNTSSSSLTIEITSLNRQLDLIKNENQILKTRLVEQDELIKTLRRDLTGASAKLSDIHGEMTEKQKRELERNKQLVIEQQRELSDNRAQMAKLSEIVDKQTKQLDTLRVELSKSKSLVEKYRLTSEENGNLAVELKSKLDDVEHQLKKFDNIKKEEGKITNELTAVGAQCKGERHEQVIQRQREALNELRHRVKILEQTRPTVPNHEVQMQQQIMLLKKQLAEVRASQALTEDIAKQANLARGNDTSFLMLEEKTAHYETQTALDASEESYLTLLRAISTILDITELDGLRSMSNLCPDERKRLLGERTKSTEAICVKIKAMLDKLERKDGILQDYELDLAKLRQAEFLLKKKSEQLDEIQVYSRSKDDEIEFLKESLKNAKSDLEREKLLNSALKQKKPVSSVQQLSERIRRESTDRLHHHCVPEDIKSNQIKKTVSEKIKRKDYELKVLKDELKTKNDELTNLTNRLSIVEKGESY
ncbi:unnamed protein product [Brachionus calyciflorus]|uniref:FHA domain-containing protein n=1 Tax=Brachionus calyciflorus TaxID=104777 RepID=A0A813PV74_9BILA|nr:unnamed protein product [Brachionus calyciflorus]